MPETEQDRLDGWKAIADYLGKNVSTVIRWERRGMPVHRVPNSKSGTVFGFRSELDAWLKSTEPDVVVSPAAPDPQPNRMGRLAWIAAAAVVLAAICLAAAWFWRAAVPAKVVFAGNQVRALTEDGRLAWSYQLPQEIAEPYEDSRTALIGDLRGDGRKEVIVRVRPDPPALGFRDLYCFNEKGKLLWNYHPRTVLRFAGTSFDGPWDIKDLMLVPEGTGQSVWVATAHFPGWPGFLASLDSKGAEKLRFVNTGQLSSVLEITNKLGRFVLVAGVSNDFREAILAVIDPSSPPSMAPAGPRPTYRCDSCVPGGPYRYYRFPRSELNNLESPEPYNNAFRIVPQEAGFEVVVSEVALGEGVRHGIIYEFTRDLEPIGFFPGSGYKKLHEQLTNEGRLNHTVEQCPELSKPRKLAVWMRDRKDWTDVYVPPIER